MRGPLALAVGAMLAVAACGSPDDAADTCDDVIPACPSPPTSYANQVQSIMASRCVPCHGPGGQEATIPLDTWANIHRWEMLRTGDILGQVHGCRMPLAPQPPLPIDERQMLESWIVCGEPDN
jgi:hypothetical protein